MAEKLEDMQKDPPTSGSAEANLADGTYELLPSTEEDPVELHQIEAEQGSDQASNEPPTNLTQEGPMGEDMGPKKSPLKLVEFDQPYPQCIAYLDLKREECGQLFPSGHIYSQAFHLAGHGFFLSAHCNMDRQNAFHCFGFFLAMQEKGSESVTTVDYEFAARTRPSGEFVSKYKGYYNFTGGKAVGYRNFFEVPWSSFMDDDNLFFINGVLHLRAELTIKKP